MSRLLAIVALVFVALAVTASAQSAANTEIAVTEAQRICTSTTDCLVFPTTCCSNCNYAAANASSANLLKGRLATTCASFNMSTCPVNIAACLFPSATCVFPNTTAGAGAAVRGLCTVNTGVVVDPPALSCSTMSTTSSCELVCTSKDVAAAAPQTLVACSATAVTTCRNTCKQNFATCGVQPIGTCGFIAVNASLRECLAQCDTLVPAACSVRADSTRDCKSVCAAASVGTANVNATSTISDPAVCSSLNTVTTCLNGCDAELASCSGTAGACSFVPKNSTTYFQCVEKCRAVAPPTTSCSVIDGLTCQKTCVATELALKTNAACATTTADAVTTCRNTCVATATCSVTSSGCSFTGTGLLDCLAKCEPVKASPLPAPVCLVSGCYNETCAQVRNLCSTLSTGAASAAPCKAKCLSYAKCSATTSNTCGWIMTQEALDCASRCVEVTPTPVVDAPKCVPGGCPNAPTCLTAALTASLTANAVACPAVLPSCEAQCLQYAQCSAASSTVANAAGVAAQCSWIPNPTNPGAYLDCLKTCSTANNASGCFVSPCGTECVNYLREGNCTLFAATDCATTCKRTYSKCSLTSTGCNFVRSTDLDTCLQKCSSVPPVSACPDGVAAVQCFADPCSVTKCAAHPDATCEANYCGGCHANFFDAKHNRVNCDPCVGLPCDKCAATAGCSFCSGSFTAASTGLVKNVGACLNSASDLATTCLANTATLVADATKCPVATSTDVKTEVAPIDTLQNQIATITETAPTKPTVSEKFVIVLTLVINETTTTATKDNLVHMYVDLVGTGAPDSTERVQICDILKNALTKVDATIPTDKLKCDLADKPTVKRDAGYLATLSYPSSSGQSSDASAVVASLAVFVVAAVALLF